MDSRAKFLKGHIRGFFFFLMMMAQCLWGFPELFPGKCGCGPFISSETYLYLYLYIYICFLSIYLAS